MTAIFQKIFVGAVSTITLISSLLFPSIQTREIATLEAKPEVALTERTEQHNPANSSVKQAENQSERVVINPQNIQNPQSPTLKDSAPKQTEEDSSKFLPKDRERAKKALVNIYCDLSNIGLKHPLTATGVIIDPRGVILTNAHVAQYILLQKYIKKGSLRCSARTGSPATETSDLKVLYISPEWVEEHSDSIFTTSPVATGEGDYALLLMASSSIPKEFGSPSFLLPETQDSRLAVSNPILLAAYPADILDPLSIKLGLFAITHETTIKKLLTFRKGQIDIISTGGSYLAQKGSSGGAVINEDGRLIGMFVTSTQEENKEERDLRAITLSHINRSLKDFSGVGLWDILAGDIFETARNFESEISPLLADIILDELRSRKSE